MLLFVFLLLLSILPAVICTESDTCSESNLGADVLILGGGITGISAAKTLHDRGVTNFLVIEAQPQLGGHIRIVELRPGSRIMINTGCRIQPTSTWPTPLDADCQYLRMWWYQGFSVRL